MIDEQSTVIDVAFAACTALRNAGIDAILSGGAAATYYAPAAYRSREADFILRYSTTKKSVAAALAAIAFKVDATDLYKSERTMYTIEFPPGPLMVGSRYVETWHVVERSGETLNVLDVTDCVRDRFMGFYAWGDYGSLRAALAVARNQRDGFDLHGFIAWAESEARDNRGYDVSRIATFLNELGPIASSAPADSNAERIHIARVVRRATDEFG